MIVLLFMWCLFMDNALLMLPYFAGVQLGAIFLKIILQGDIKCVTSIINAIQYFKKARYTQLYRNQIIIA